MSEREPFEPIGEVARRKMVLDGIDAMPPLEAGTLITYGMISEWLGEPFPIPRAVGDGTFVVPDFGPMDEVKRELHKRRIHLQSEANLGYRVATSEQASIAAEKKYRRTITALTEAACIARCVDPDRVSHAEARRAAELQQDVREQRRVMTVAAQQRARRARLFGT